MKKINPNLYPSAGGYLFTESDGARIYADSWAGVVARVRQYRKRAKLPPGEPPTEVMAQACAANPALCSENNRAYVEQLGQASLKTRVLSWLMHWKKQPARPLVEVSLAQARGNACAGCPQNTDLPGGCASCEAALEELTEAVIGSRKRDGRLRGCRFTGEYLPVAAHLDLQTVEDGRLPDYCWRKRTL